MRANASRAISRSRYDIKLKPISKCPRQELSSTIRWPARILGSEDPETWMSFDQSLSFRYKEFTIVIKHTVQGLENVWWGQVELVKDDPVAHAHGKS